MGGFMKLTTATIAGVLLANSVNAKPVVDTVYSYTGPAVPVGDWVDSTVNGNGKGFPRLVEPPAVKPASKNPTNNINVISVAYAGSGVNIHYQTPFGLGTNPEVKWGSSPNALDNTQTGSSHSYDRTPPCSQVVVTQCSQHFHEVQLANLKPDTSYYYKISAANGTTASEVLSFTTARDAGSKKGFTVAVLNDMGYTNAGGTYRELNKAVDDGAAFAWHGGDISYADDWYSGILPCESSWPVCYNGTSTELPGGNVPPEYDVPLPKGEAPNQGGPQGGDMSVLYESNWDLWQQWTNSITTKIPYMVLPGNHEASCGEFDGPGNVLTAYLNNNQTNSTAPKSALTYYSCPPSQRNYTAYQHRFRMPGVESGGVGNFWYSFDYGLAHFISFNGETDYPYSPEWPFARDLKGGETHPKESETFITDSGPFGAVDGSIYVKESYEQYNWLVEDLKKVDRTKTPWVIAMSHRPMYSSQVSSYQKNMRNAFEALFLEYGVDVYLSGHIHWYERTLPLGPNGTIDQGSVVNHNTYYTNEGKSMTHLINGMAGNIESHSTIPLNQTLNITEVLNQADYGFSKLKIVNETLLTWDFVKGADGSIGDSLTLIKRGTVSSTTSSSGTSTATSTATSTGSSAGSSTGSPTGSSTGSPTGSSTATSTGSAGSSTTASTASSITSTDDCSDTTSADSSTGSSTSSSITTSTGSAGSSTTISTASSATSTDDCSDTTSADSSTGTSTATSTATSTGSSAGFSTGSSTGSSAAPSTPTSSAGTDSATGTTATSSSTSVGSVVTVTDVVTAYTTFCPAATTIMEGNQTYTATEATTLTITNCPCTRTYTTTATGPAGVAVTQSAPTGSAATSLHGGNTVVPVASGNNPGAPQESGAEAVTSGHAQGANSAPAQTSQGSRSQGSGIQGTAPGSPGSAATQSAPPAVGAGFRSVVSTSIVGFIGILVTMAMF